MTDTDRLRKACADAVMTCGPLTLRIVAKWLGITTEYRTSEDAGKPWRAAE